MAISNTSILIKRSLTTGKPTSLNAGEFAYSYASNTLFIGTPDGNGVVNVGGHYYTSTLDAATNANVASTLVKRDSAGSFYGRLYGNANTATKLIDGRNFNIGGGDITSDYVGFDGSSSVTLNASLNTIDGLIEGVYGGSTLSSSNIPVIHVAANGRIMEISNTSVSSSFNITDGTSTQLFESGNTLSVLGTSGIVSTVTENTVTLSTDNTVFRSNVGGGTQIILSDVFLSGNLIVHGNTTSINVSSYTVEDPLIYLAANNYSSDLVDIGFAANYYDGDQRHTGFFRDFSTKQYYLFDNLTQELSGNNAIDRFDSSFRIATINANLVSSTIQTDTLSANTANTVNNFGVGGDLYVTGSTQSTSYTFDSGLGSITTDGTNVSIYSGDDILSGVKFEGNGYILGPNGARNIALNYGGTSGLVGLYKAEVYDTTDSSGSTSGALVVDGGAGIAKNLYVGGNTVVTGRTTLVGRANTSHDFGVGENAYITGSLSAASLSLTNALPISSGGTNNDGFYAGQLTYFDGSKIASLANTGTAGTYGSSSSIPIITTDALGRVSGVSTSSISIDASQVTSGVLGVTRGGTGISAANSNGIIFGNGTSSFNVTSVAGVNDQTWSNQILTVTNSGTPVWSSVMDGGNF